jgi:hypothetical protein
MICDGTGVFHPRKASDDSPWKSPSFEFHEAMNLLSVNVDAIAEATTAPCGTHATGRLLFMELLGACSEDFVDGAWLAPPGLVVGSGSRQVEP